MSRNLAMIIRILKNLYGISVILLIIGCQSALADKNPAQPYKITASTNIASDYVFRGYSQTDEQSAIQASLGITHSSGLSLSVWGSNVDFNNEDKSSLEIDTTASYSFPINSYNITLGGTYYAYPGADRYLNYDYAEAFIGLSRVFDKYGDYNIQAYYSPDFFAGSKDAFYIVTSASIPTPIENLKIVGNVGYQWVEENDQFGAPDYTDWSLGTSYTYDIATISIRYYDTNVSNKNCNNLCSPRGVLNLSMTF